MIKGLCDGPRHPAFESRAIRGSMPWKELAHSGVSLEMAEAAAAAPRGACVFRGLPFHIGSRPVLITEGGRPRTVRLPCVKARWLVFAHTSDVAPSEADNKGFIRHSSGVGHLAEHAADYVIVYTDGSEERAPVRRRHQLGEMCPRWGENCTEAVTHSAPIPIRQEQQSAARWGWTQRRATGNDRARWLHWLWAWQNPHPDREIVALRLEPVCGTAVVAGVSWGNASVNPLRWERRRKAVLSLPSGQPFSPNIDEYGSLSQVTLDMGVVISAQPRLLYPEAQWRESYNNALPAVSEREMLVEFSAHQDANFHLSNDQLVPVSALVDTGAAGPMRGIKPAEQRVTVRIVERATGQPVAAKLHIHGEAGEYLPPLHLHRLPNSNWFEDYSPEFQHARVHRCVYIDGEADVNLPHGTVYLEVSKGFEIRPVRLTHSIEASTRELVIEIETVLPWRENGWVTADTHVHFLSPTTALLEGAAEGVNVVNLLASQWGELMTNAGDFDGKTVHGAKQFGGDGEYLVRVGTENRHHVLGHISLLGYDGRMILPMTSGGPDEAAIGDPVDVLLTDWARQCKAQGGVVVIPHFPNPRLEHAATIVEGEADAIEMTAWGYLYGGIDPYSLSDWYRYLNNGYLVAAVAGTDKMTAATAVGTVRTYARIAPDREFTYAEWMDAVRRAETFVSYGPLMEVSVDGHPLGARIEMPASGGTVAVAWHVASVTMPMTQVELVLNGEVVDGADVDPQCDSGSFEVSVDRSSWVALLVRGCYADKPEIIAAHSSPVMIDVEDSAFYSAADALTILHQIEGALAYLDTVSTRAATDNYQRMRLVLTSAHRRLHNRMHAQGVFHNHSITEKHAAHGQ